MGYFLTEEDRHIAEHWAARDLMHPHSDLHGLELADIMDDFLLRVYGYCGEIAYCRIMGFPVEYHSRFGIDSKRNGRQIKTVDDERRLFIRFDDIKQFDENTRYVLMRHESSGRYRGTYEYVGEAPIKLFIQRNQITDFGTGREPVLYLTQNQLRELKN